MAGLGSVVVQFMASDKMSKTVNGISGALKGMGGATDKTKAKIGKFAALTAGAFAGIGGLVIATGVAFVDMAKGAEEDAKQADNLARILGSLKGVTREMIDENEEWITSMQLATHVSDTELRVAVGSLALATGDLGKAQKLTALAVDTAAGSGKNLTTVTDALVKAESGQYTQLKRLYPWLDKNKDGTLTYKEAVKGLEKAYGGAAKAAADQDVWTKLGIIWDELQESLGGLLLPVLKKVSDWFASKDNQKKINEYIGKVGDLASKFGDDLLGAIEDFIAWLKKPENRKKIEEWITKVEKMATAVGEVVTWLISAIAWLERFYNKLRNAPINPFRGLVGLLPGSGGTQSHAGPSTRATGASTAAPTPAPVVMVTDEQIARAVQRILMRSDARNGRITRIA